LFNRMLAVQWGKSITFIIVVKRSLSGHRPLPEPSLVRGEPCDHA